MVPFTLPLGSFCESVVETNRRIHRQFGQRRQSGVETIDFKFHRAVANDLAGFDDLSGRCWRWCRCLRLSGDSVVAAQCIGEEQAIALLELIVSSVHRMIASSTWMLSLAWRAQHGRYGEWPQGICLSPDSFSPVTPKSFGLKLSINIGTSCYITGRQSRRLAGIRTNAIVASTKERVVLW